jgi:Flp pilus assembly protein TadG
MPDERGTAALWVLGLCVALMFLGGLGLDFWRAIAERRALSARADAAATAGANGLDEGALRDGVIRLDSARAELFARDQLRQSANMPDASDVRVSGNTVTVALRDHVDFSLLGIFMPGDRFEFEVQASARPDERS